ncbi:hypothetical protein FAUST_3581 [Fusarium austroamericanum]|uniref:Uncharacterized protein n=1 Tax=Fusarium austroamericanum TaxID=282268 RepID=A0AAN6C4I9_FUSAU|nr:hypothetical protein FAUST_3581 [Fusarium austroamericanum]
MNDDGTALGNAENAAIIKDVRTESDDSEIPLLRSQTVSDPRTPTAESTTYIRSNVSESEILADVVSSISGPTTSRCQAPSSPLVPQPDPTEHIEVDFGDFKLSTLQVVVLTCWSVICVEERPFAPNNLDGRYSEALCHYARVVGFGIPNREEQLDPRRLWWAKLGLQHQRL